MLASLFARGVYTDELLAGCLGVAGNASLAETSRPAGRTIQQVRWKMRLARDYMPEKITISKRFYEVTTAKGPVNGDFLTGLAVEYAKVIRELGWTGDR